MLKFYCYAKFRYAECNCVECYHRKCSLSEVLHFQGFLSVVMLSVCFAKCCIFFEMLGVLNVILQNVVMLGNVMLKVVMLSVIMQTVVELSALF